ncbi:hypothetical protein AXG93_1793s1210 [Marchantia polymorpha subsp. ruderalis]|uniref:Uncharacterized protein n=1 Tax=Marchantia polymorpha subsp. ruderalis TaxID=1480154 RepID=A0A176WGI5_MARPO|nr:hypothetical protein AXG93_1793s1210 [Marchantia polymorpha subsp. ruderalis]
MEANEHRAKPATGEEEEEEEGFQLPFGLPICLPPSLGPSNEPSPCFIVLSAASAEGGKQKLPELSNHRQQYRD